MKRNVHKPADGAATALLRVRVQPRASRSEITGWREGVLQVRLTGPPVEGAANAACTELLADTLKVAKSAITLVAGAKAREKSFRITGLTQAEAERRLNLILG